MRLTVHRPLSHEIVRRARDAGLAGAVVLRGIEGYGAGSLIHTSRLPALSENLPIVIIIVDRERRIREFLPQLDELMHDGLVTLDRVEAIRYSRGRPR